MGAVKKTVGIVGLGLIGGSFAKAYQESGAWKVLAFDTNTDMLHLAQLAEDVDGELTAENVGDCDLLLIAIYPEATIAYLKEMAPHLAGKDTLVMDCCGIKREVCEVGFELARRYDFTFLGGHPMAGRHLSGYKYSVPTLFRDASMVLVPESMNDLPLISRAKELLAPAMFGRVTISTADRHDEMIAFTSQLAHVVSNAYVKSPTAKSHQGFSAGSYKDLTRVAWLNETMWTELFLENKEHLLFELDTLIGSLQAYRDAIAAGDGETLKALLAEGKHCKEAIDGKL